MAPADESWYQQVPEHHRHRIGAGGVVVRPAGTVLLVALIKEVDIGDAHYVLPKGGVEAGEDIEQAARREILEETGLSDLTHLGPLGALARRNFKKTYWQTSHYGLYLTRQIEGGPTDPDNYGLAWFSIEELPPMFWPDERELIVGRREWIRQRAETL